MAEYILDVASQTSKLDWAFPFQRTGAFPIDRSAVFSSLTDAQNYALGVAEGEEAKDVRKLGGTSYVGQIISVYESVEGGAASANAYIITPTRGLMKLAATTASGDVSADIADLQGKVNTLMSQVEALQTSNAKKAEKEYVDTELAKKALQSDLEEEVTRAKAAEKVNADAIALKANSADVYKKTETYTQAEVQSYVQGQIGSAGHLKRKVVETLPAVAEADVDTIYMIRKSVNSQLTGDYYEEYLIIEGAFEKIGDTHVDLSSYATKTYVDGEIDKVEETLNDKADQISLDETNEALAKKAEKDYVDTELGKKADKSQVATDIQTAISPLAVKTDVETELSKKADKTALEELTNTVNGKADKATTLAGYNIGDAYTKKQVDDLLLLKASQEDHNQLVDIVNGKADKATTLAGYGITDAYTKSEVYTKSEADTKIDEKIASVTGGESAADVKLALESYRDAINVEIWGPEAANWSGTDAEGKPTYNPQYGSDSRLDKLEAVGAQANIIEAIKLQGATSTLPIADKTVTLPAATAEAFGLVKLSSEVGVDANNALEIKSMNVNKLSQNDGEWLILNGGSAEI